VQLGPGRLLQDYGTSTRSAVIEMANGKAQIEFVPDAGRTTTIEARTMELRGSYCVIKEE
jgi:beta-galactosidase